MAEGKNSFVLYVDSKETWDELTDEQAGKLIKHVFKYVNDEDPVCDDPLVKIAFLPIKQSLKRDLKKWESKQKQRSEAGKRSAEARKKALDEKQRKATTVESRSTNPTVSGSVSVNGSVSGNEIKEYNREGDKSPVFNFKQSLLDLGIEKEIVSDWLKVRAKKKATNTATSFNSIKNQITKTGKAPNECIKIAVENSWSGFKADWLNNTTGKAKQTSMPVSDYSNVTKEDLTF